MSSYAEERDAYNLHLAQTAVDQMEALKKTLYAMKERGLLVQIVFNSNNSKVLGTVTARRETKGGNCPLVLCQSVYEKGIKQ